MTRLKTSRLSYNGNYFDISLKKSIKREKRNKLYFLECERPKLKDFLTCPNGNDFVRRRREPSIAMILRHRQSDGVEDSWLPESRESRFPFGHVKILEA